MKLYIQNKITYEEMISLFEESDVQYKQELREKKINKRVSAFVQRMRIALHVKVCFIYAC